MLIALHLGAHKTATTYIQEALELSGDRLSEAGIGYVPLRTLRPTITERLGFGRRGLRNSVDQLVEEHRDCKRLILSDENIIGGLKPSSFGGFYPKRRRRLGKLLARLGPHEVRIYFATRSYDEFLSAMYCEYIRHHPFIDAHSYLRGVDYERFSWVDVVRTFVSLADGENVTLWRHEDFPAVEEQAFAALAGDHQDLIQKPVGLIRESLSLSAVQILACQPPTRDPDELRARARKAAAAHPKGPDNPPFSAFGPAAAGKLRARYKRDIAVLLHDFPAIRFIDRDRLMSPDAR